jgi:hypothetical protein
VISLALFTLQTPLSSLVDASHIAHFVESLVSQKAQCGSCVLHTMANVAQVLEAGTNFEKMSHPVGLHSFALGDWHWQLVVASRQPFEGLHYHSSLLTTSIEYPSLQLRHILSLERLQNLQFVI